MQPEWQLVIERLNILMSQKGIDACIASSPENIFYTSGFHALEPFHTLCGVVCQKDGPSILLIPKPEEGFIDENFIANETKVYGDFYIVRSKDTRAIANDYAGAVSSTLRDMGLQKGTIGLDERYLPHHLFDELQKAVPDAKLVFASSLFYGARLVKSDREIDKLRNTAKKAEEALLETYNSTHEGQTELEWTDNLVTNLMKRGAQSLFNEMGAGIRSGYPTHPSNYKIKNGDVVHIDFGASFSGYSSDMARNAVLKEPKPQQLKVNDALKKGNEEVIRQIKPGLRVSEVFDIMVGTIRKNGIPDYQRHHVGHSIGIPPHEPPRIERATDRLMEKGMVFCIEAPYYSTELGGFNVENILAVTDDGCEALTKSSQDLYILS